MESYLVKISAFFLLFYIAGCSAVQPGSGSNWIGYTETGQASYYADKQQNRRTANGSIYKHKLKTAAHKDLPFGLKVKVTNLKNGKSVIVMINDRGPYIEGRIIDLSKSAFRSIGSISSGLIIVKIEVVDRARDKHVYSRASGQSVQSKPVTDSI
ncbi:septal ring lytic transglycosylase RlpA family protein [Desulfobulbus rhabdoformis]|uniref:septal ring lytic transglycosylase RlpA family protein n=1 Tax=Desulfobulbus rhabdoformis TaxID=34032 RepID=UPI001963BCE4|nr:septal ring lytic transglycosylase RlpA family protein [Desulfobulbus rhabdoformis]